jgi:hypothetical protein
MSNLLFGLAEMLRRFGTLEQAFLCDYREDDETVLPALTSFAERLSGYAGGDHGILVSFPDKGSASKRLHLFLRWMVRSDELDLGLWHRVDTAKLIVPVDTHMLRIARYLGLTERKTADRRAAEEVTASFRRVNPADPAMYDFALTRAGIHPGLSRQSLADSLGCLLNEVDNSCYILVNSTHASRANTPMRSTECNDTFVMFADTSTTRMRAIPTTE